MKMMISLLKSFKILRVNRILLQITKIKLFIKKQIVRLYTQ